MNSTTNIIRILFALIILMAAVGWLFFGIPILTVIQILFGLVILAVVIRLIGGSI